MTRERAKELLPVIQAFADGKTIQAKWDDRKDTWDDQINPDFADYPSLKYRVKPEPREWYLKIAGESEITGWGYGPDLGILGTKQTIIKVREVLD